MLRIRPQQQSARSTVFRGKLNRTRNIMELIEQMTTSLGYQWARDEAEQYPRVFGRKSD
jgi:uncharacterized protein YukE